MKRLAILCLVLAGFAAQPRHAPAQEAGVLTPEALQKRLSQFDPRAVAAAKHYSESPQLKAGVLAMADSLGKAMMAMVARQQPGLSPDQQAKAQRAVTEALGEQFGLLQNVNMLATLETFSTDELVALDNFYSSPTGAAIMAKMPQLATRVGPTVQNLLPTLLNSVQAKLKAQGIEPKP